MPAGKPPFDDLYRDSVTRIYAFVKSQVGEVADAEDITSQVFIKAWEAYERYQPRHQTPAPWLYQIARNAILDHHRRGQRRDRLVRVVAHQPQPAEDPSLLAESRIRHQELMEAVKRLPARHREVVGLRHTGLSFAEVGALMAISEDAAKMLHQRALRALRADLAQPGGPP